MLESAIGSSRSINDLCGTCGSILSTRHLKPLVVAKGISKKPRKPRRTPESLASKDARTDVKIAMLTAIPGVSAVKATAILDECESSLVRLVGASSTELARVVVGDAPLGQRLGVAIWRALH